MLKLKELQKNNDDNKKTLNVFFIISIVWSLLEFTTITYFYLKNYIPFSFYMLITIAIVVISITTIFLYDNEDILLLSFIFNGLMLFVLFEIYQDCIVKRNFNVINSDYTITKEYKTKSYFNKLNYCYVEDDKNNKFFVYENKRIKISGVDGVCRKNIKTDIQDGKTYIIKISYIFNFQ